MHVSPDTPDRRTNARETVFLVGHRERRDRFARNSAHPRRLERSPATRVSIHSWPPSHEARHFSQTFPHPRDEHERPKRNGGSANRVVHGHQEPRCALYARLSNDREREDRSTEGNWRTAVRGEMSNTKTQNSRFRVLGRSRGKVSRTTRGRREKGKPGGGSRSSRKGEKDHGQRDSFLFVRYLICYGSVPCFCAADSEGDASSGK